jgi:hypothetical protein
MFEDNKDLTRNRKDQKKKDNKKNNDWQTIHTELQIEQHALQ